MNKAYDRVNWRFLLKVLQAYGFPAQWIQLISQCISTVSYRILVNGQVTESFHSHCGLRQGDPLSPYLFLLCMDIFSRMIIMATDIRLFDGIRAHRYAPSISHLFFADDALLFFKASTASCKQLSKLLDRFCRSLGTYLGTPVDIQGKKTQHFTFLLDNISQRITAWNHSPISQAGKLILINSVLIASIAHILSVFLIPTTVANKLDAMLARFFWSNSSGKGIAWKSKELLHLQKGAGGLGLRSIAMHNRSLLMKKVWRIQKNSGDLISKVFCDRNVDTGFTTPKLRSVRGQCSWGARGLIQAEQILLTNSCWKIGSNSPLLAGKERWVRGRFPSFGIIFSSHCCYGLHCFTPAASTTRLECFPPSVPFSSSTVRNIRTLEVPRLTNQVDVSIWPFTSSGNYTTKSGYYFLSRHTDIYNMTPLPIRSFSGFYGGYASCQNGKFSSGNYSTTATAAWQTSQLRIHSNATPMVAFKDWLIAWIHYFYQQDGYNGLRLPVFVAILWAIWQGRNNKVFNGIAPDMPLIRSLQDKGPPGFLFAHFGTAFCGVPQLHIQVDGSWKKSSILAGIAWVAEHVSTQTTEVQGGCIYAESPLVAEARACLGALVWAQSRGYGQILIYTDSDVLVRV
ncbi:uncharacterized protein LOC130591143 [Beta vulgaris subsp. vulgaris]|uniref:uncharacterized protein LOC130591143 n=1 Tax=Beta vulgaris subsp. vulgaris TaxID=3555 RepID=UPI0025482BE4|nr:uncharacterized protein LOC130591143 [Beta vulgaris subsp. vulgaris]